MTTKRMRGRDPEQNLIHATVAEADAFKGMHGQITAVANGVGDQATIIQLRFHNGVAYGGFIVPLTPAAEVPAPIALSRVVGPLAVQTSDVNEIVNITHELGYLPMVQVLGADGRQLAVDVVHNDDQSLSFDANTYFGQMRVFLR